VVTSNPVFGLVGDILCPIAEISPSIAYSSSSTGREIAEVRLSDTNAVADQNMMKDIFKENGALVLAEGVGSAKDD